MPAKFHQGRIAQAREEQTVAFSRRSAIAVAIDDHTLFQETFFEPLFVQVGFFPCGDAKSLPLPAPVFGIFGGAGAQTGGQLLNGLPILLQRPHNAGPAEGHKNRNQKDPAHLHPA